MLTDTPQLSAKYSQKTEPAPQPVLPLFGLYVHWPFCLSKCPYCDFNSHVQDQVDHKAWARAYEREIDYYGSLTGGRTVTSIFFGGGTPSLMAPETVEAVLERIAARWTVAPGCEVTLEANPTSVEADKFRAFRRAGVNRVSLGVQALNDKDLQALGRTHSAEEGRAAVALAASVFDRYSFDLIYARPEQDLAGWQDELTGALALAGDHLSLYQLTIEPGTAFKTLYDRGDLAMPDNDLAGDFYDLTQDIMDGAGLPAYEISNHARPGEESRHNLTYWRYGDYAGIGPGAHGRLTLDGVKQATRAHRAPSIWLERVAQNGHGGHPFEEIPPADSLTEALMMGLRLREGLDLNSLPVPWQDHIAPERINTLAREGLVYFENGTAARLRPSRAGMIRLDSVLRFLLT